MSQKLTSHQNLKLLTDTDVQSSPKAGKSTLFCCGYDPLGETAFEKYKNHIIVIINRELDRFS